MNNLITNILTLSDIKNLYVETFLNNTNKVSKITDLSVLNAHAFAIAKLLQKDLKETAIVESQLFPQLSSGSYLDSAAKYIGGVSRLQATGSYTYVRVNADSGTQYIPGVSTFTSNNGIQFEMIEPSYVGVNGYTYIQVRSTTLGSNTNVDPLTINKVINPPVGHLNCTNEYASNGGRDTESDEDFKIRLSTFGNLVAKETQLSILENLKLNDNRILKLVRNGFTDSGKISFGIVTCNGVGFTTQELKSLENKLSNFVSISDLNQQGQNIGIELLNKSYLEIDVDFRLSIVDGFTEEEVRKSIQINLTKYFHFNRWFSKVEWDDLLEVVKSTSGVSYVPDEFFGICKNGGTASSSDIVLSKLDIPRIKGFIMKDISGDILFKSNNNILPVYYA